METALALYLLIAPALPRHWDFSSPGLGAAGELIRCRGGARSACLEALKREEARGDPDLELVDYLHDLVGSFRARAR